MNSKEIRNVLNMSQREFSVKYSIPLGTVRNWDSRNCMPIYMSFVFDEIKQLRYEINQLRLENVMLQKTVLLKTEMDDWNL